MNEELLRKVIEGLLARYVDERRISVEDGLVYLIEDLQELYNNLSELPLNPNYKGTKP